MNQWKLNILLHHAVYHTPILEEHVASSHGQPTDVTPTPLLFFQTHTHTHTHTHTDTHPQKSGRAQCVHAHDHANAHAWRHVN